MTFLTVYHTGKMLDRSSFQSFSVSRNLQKCPNSFFIEAKIYKKNIRLSDTTLNSISTLTWLCVTSNMKSSQNTKPEEKNMGGHGLTVKVGGHVPCTPHQIAPMHVSKC